MAWHRRAIQGGSTVFRHRTPEPETGVAHARIITVEGQIDPAEVIALQRRVTGALDAGHRRIVVDLSAVTGFALPTLSLFCGALRRVNRRAATLAIVGAPPHARRAVELCAIEGVELHPTVKAARDARA